MDGMVEENGTSGGNGDPLAQSPTSVPHPIAVTSVREPTIVTYTPTSHKVLGTRALLFVVFLKVGVFLV